ncbi:hypothetical protein GUITHDRAFT_107876 [Guillardia theta CCMP2712]|uniref:Uncharacterized protein n=1 Tax=Guillardia theta (strain CCMP2712) TaxID=905079 RepID=L1JDU1_GUITC|nr:hypothetical protein GUITHDRAFT_107876 [Guillardia theta CCMP2712]EKX46265.1 hypothetical protein GUITHDRAFT_107876 [Guillardia theta CCMP2712]|eukprot:XP_005833245.1 hypothetical protein GUITHDRAFT_107876 [Guillardia theta CCMP2712]
MLWGTMAFAKTITTVKDIGMLVVDVIFKGEGAMCTLCDKVMTMMLSGEAEGGLSDIDCRAMCFGLKRCITICDKLVKIDEFGEVPKCKYHFPASCEATIQHVHLQISRLSVVGRLQEMAKGMNKMMSENVGALANALGKAPKCGEPGGDDDRQWLSFWIIFLILNVIENMTDVLLSWIPSYYEAKFVLLAWLIFFEGADILYRRVHSLFEVIHALLVRLHVIPEVVYEEWNEEEYLETLPLGLAETIKECGGPGCVFRKFTSRSDMEDMLRDRRTKQLLRAFEDVNPRYVEVHLVKAEGLAAMDANGLSDPYCLLSLVPTAREEEEIEDASSHALTRFARLKLLVQSGLSAVISRLKA